MVSRATGRVYARKRIKRNKLPKDAQKEFERELRALKEVEAHEHLVRVCGTYTDRKYLALLLEPVAECNLKEYLKAGGPRNPLERATCFTYFCCMARVLSFLHDEKQIIHKDIKPENFLLLNGRILLTDFGTSYDFSRTGQSMTRSNSDDAITPRYVSPEVSEKKEFHRASDIWSLGVVFLEMATVLLKMTITQLDSYLVSHGRKSVLISENRDAALSWFTELRKSDCLPRDYEPLVWIRSMLEMSHKSRPTASDLFATSSTCQSGRFCARCCSDHETEESDSETESSLLSSDLDVVEETKPKVIRRTSEAVSNFSKTVPGAFPTDDFLVEYREPFFTNVSIPITTDRHAINPLRLPRGSRSTSSPMTSTNLQGKQNLAVQSRDTRSRDIRFTEHGWIRSRKGSRSNKTNETTTNTESVTTPTIRDQRMKHYLTSLPGDEEQFDQIIEDNSGEEAELLNSAVNRTFHVENPQLLTKTASSEYEIAKSSRKPEQQWTQYFVSRSPARVRSQENLRCDHENVAHRADDGIDFCAPGLIRYPSDTDLKRQYLEADGHAAETIDSWKHWSANFILPPLLVSYRSDQDSAADKDWQTQDQQNDSDPQWNLISAILDRVHPKPAHPEVEDAAGTNVHKTEEASAQRPIDESGLSKRDKTVTFSEKVEVHVHEDTSPQPVGEEINPPDAGEAEEKIRVEDGLNHSTKIENPSQSTTAPLGSFLKQVPVTRASTRRSWEAATTVMKRILEDKASVAPTSVMSERTRQMLKGGPVLMRYNDNYYGYLPHFVNKGKVRAVRELLKGGCNPGTKHKPRFQPVYLAVTGATDNHNKCLLALVNQGADVTVKSSGSGKTCLHYAVEQEPWPGYSTTVYILLKTGANPNTVDKNGTTPFVSLLTGAGPMKKEERDALLIFLAPNFETNVDIRDPNLNENALHLTIRRQDPYALDAVLHAVKSDAQKKVMLAESNASGFDPLLLVLSTCSFATQESAESSARMLELLLEHGADPNSRDETKGDTALHLVIGVHKSTEAMELLLRFKASLTKRNKKKITPKSLLHEKAGNEKTDPWYAYAEKRWLTDS